MSVRRLPRLCALNWAIDTLVGHSTQAHEHTDTEDKQDTWTHGHTDRTHTGHTQDLNLSTHPYHTKLCIRHLSLFGVIILLTPARASPLLYLMNIGGVRINSFIKRVTHYSIPHEVPSHESSFNHYLHILNLCHNCHCRNYDITHTTTRDECAR